ncbi:hexon [Duck adenovirus 3]|uniref:Hexon protein n=3 Tax=Duck aviadenovirus B TaxID=1534553 RepID=A0A5F2P0D4_9ADEN|nr:hexon [Duck adenovirus 2]AWW17719.1 hexon [Duck adenovirus 3]QKX94115.1 hexon [Duck aviadenovirus B]AWW17720.1 hexon [Duck adenovirus 3]AWW17721.1 hexon [Duck adenovirus 3]
MAALTPDLTTATPRLSYFHIAGPSTREYLSEDLQQFMSATSSYFELRNKFRQTVAAPTRNVTTEKAQRLQIRYYPIQTDETSNTHRVRFSMNVGDSWVLDMGSTYFDIKGVLDRGSSFKPYSGTAYNPLAPKESVFNFWYTHTDSKNYIGAQLSTLYENTDPGTGTPTQNVVKAMSGVNPDPNQGSSISVPELLIGDTNDNKFSGVAKVAKAELMLAHGAYVKPVAPTGSQSLSQTGYVLSSDGSTKYNGAISVEDYTSSLQYPDSLYIPPNSTAVDNFGVTKGLRPNYIGFRDNFINILYHDSGVCSGTLNSERSGMNVVVALQDRNTELSYQYMLADMMSRHHYFALWNQAVDQYDHDVRVFNNDGYEDVSSSYAFYPNCLGFQPGGELYTKLKVVKTDSSSGAMSGGEVANTSSAFGVGNIPAYEINIPASMKRIFIMSNIADYLPDKYKVSIDSTDGVDQNSYEYMNKRVPLTNIVDLFTNIGARWSVDQMDNVNPFNHHRNWGLKYRSQLLGNSRYCQFHIQVPQKYFAIKNLLLLPGTYTYEWVLRKDPNMVLQSSLGNDLRLDKASITFTEVNLMASFMPMDHNTSNQLELMMRNATNDQTFMDYLGAKNALYSIPAGSNQVTINIPARTWEGMRGWSFTRLKTKETPQQGAQYDVAFKYSGSIPYLDGTFYLNHTFKNMSVLFDTSINWPGNDRLMSPNMFEIKRAPAADSEGFTMSQCDITKDWWLIQMATNYNFVYNGYRFWPDRHYFQYDFLRNFDPMSRQSPNFSQSNGLYDLVSVDNTPSTGAPKQEYVRNNSGFVAPRAEPVSNARQGHAWPANWPYPLIGKHCIDSANITQYKKFLCDNYLWTIPFSSDFMYMGELTDLGQNPMYTNNSHSMVINFEVDPMDEDTYLYMLYGVFDAVRVNQPERNVLAMAYFRTPFATGNAV